MVEEISSLADVVIDVLKRKRQLGLGKLVEEVRVIDEKADEKDVWNILGVLEQEGLADIQYNMTRIDVAWLGGDGSGTPGSAGSRGILSLSRLGGTFELRQEPGHGRQKPESIPDDFGCDVEEGGEEDEDEFAHPTHPETSFDVRKYADDRTLERRELAELQHELAKLTHKASKGAERGRAKQAADDISDAEWDESDSLGAEKWAGVKGIGTIGASPLPGHEHRKGTMKKQAQKPRGDAMERKGGRQLESGANAEKQRPAGLKPAELKELKDYELINSAKKKLNESNGNGNGKNEGKGAESGAGAAAAPKAPKTEKDGSGFSKRTFLLLIGGFAVIALLASMAAGVSPFAVLGSLFSGSGTGAPAVAGGQTVQSTSAVNGVSSGNGAGNGTVAAQQLSAEVQLEVSDKGYSPALIEIQNGTELTVAVSNKGIYPHAFMIDEFGVSLSVKPGAKGSATFTANRTGTFAFYSNVSYYDPVMSMPKYDSLEGKLIVS